LKAGCCYLLSAITLGAAPISVFFQLAIAWSILNFGCLLLARVVLAAVRVEKNEEFPFVIMVGNIIFGAVILLLGALTSATTFDFRAVIPIILVLVAVNLLPVQISLALGYLGNRIRKSRVQSRF
jgi:hypothetical protein